MKHKNLTLVIIVGTLALSLTTIFLTNRSSNQRLAMNTQAATVSTEANLKVAFMGDAALGKTAEDVLTLIKNESAAAVVHVGDFEYKNNPGAFDAQIQKILGTSIPYFGVPGNHDTANWSGTGGYKEVLSNRSGSFCTGDYGSQAYCNFKGLGLMLLGVGTTVSKDNAAQMNFIKTAAASNTWKICNWHKNQNAMQIGGKGDEVGWGAFEACREAGAIIMSGHEYSYERTKTLISTTNQTVDPSCNSVTAPCIGPGKAIVIVTGLAGASMRDQQRCLPAVAPYGCKGEWAKIYSTTQGSVHGALFMVFNYNGDPNKAHGYFKNVNGQVIDDFVVTAAGGTGGPTATPGSGIPSNTPSAGCAKRSQGDANCDNAIDITDFEIFRKEYTGQLSTKSADYDGDGSVTVADFEAWRKGYFGISASTTSTTGISPTISSTSPTPTRTTTNTPQQVSKGIWISTEEIAKLPMSGSGWTNVKAAADSNWGSANLGDNDSPHDILTLAGALVAVRTNNAAMRSKTIAGLNSAMQSPLTRALELGRGLQTYIIAADIIGYRDAAFMSWVQKMVHVKITGHSCSGEGLLCTAQSSANNWGGHARASVTAAALYLNDTALLTDMANSYKAFIGINSPNSSKMVYTSTTWHAGSPIAGVNVNGATKNGQNMSGIIPEDWRRGGEYKWPPTFSGYMWEGMQGFIVTAVLLHRANVLPFTSGDNVIVRSMNMLYKINYPPGGDDTWIPWVANYYGGTNYSTSTATGGKNIGWTDWTHAK